MIDAFGGRAAQWSASAGVTARSRRARSSPTDSSITSSDRQFSSPTICPMPLGISLTSTIRKMTRRLGAETVAEMTRTLIMTATRERRFRPRAVRIDSTVIEANIKHPTDAGLAGHGVRALAREGRKLQRLIGEKRSRVRDRSRAMGQKLRGIARTVRRRSGEAKAEVLKLTKETGELLERSLTEARQLATVVRRRVRGRGAQAKLKAAAGLEELV